MRAGRAAWRAVLWRDCRRLMSPSTPRCACYADVARQARAMITAGVTPPPVLTPGCRRCSLHDECCPERLHVSANQLALAVNADGRVVHAQAAQHNLCHPRGCLVA